MNSFHIGLKRRCSRDCIDSPCIREEGCELDFKRLYRGYAEYAVIVKPA